MKVLRAVRGPEQGTEVTPALLYVPTGLRPRPAVLDRLARLGVPFAAANDPSHAARLLAGRPIPLMLVDLAGDRGALAAIRALRASHPQIPIVAIADAANAIMSGEALHAGAMDLVSWPFEDREVLAVLANARDVAPAAEGAASQIGLVAQSSAMRGVVDQIHRAASSRTNVIVRGEPGTGRSIVARAIHDLAACGEWVAEDCGAGSPDDVERRLFGVAVDGRRPSRTAGFERISRNGAIHAARGGTLYLRNVADAPARVQARLARVLRDREAELVEQQGTLVDLDVRVIAAIGPGIEDAVDDGRVRSDLYERLGQARIDVPALRDRREDVPMLAVQWLDHACASQQVPRKSISRGALKLIAALPWHGHVTELRQFMDTLVRTVDRPLVEIDDVLTQARLEGAAVRIEAGVSLREAKARFERECIGAVLARHDGRVSEAARALGIQRTNLYRKVRQLKVTRPKALRRSDR